MGPAPGGGHADSLPQRGASLTWAGEGAVAYCEIEQEIWISWGWIWGDGNPDSAAGQLSDWNDSPSLHFIDYFEV